MKRTILTAAVVLLSVITFGKNNDFDSAMKSKLETLRSGEKGLDYKKMGDEFSKIAKKNKTRFEPLYYSAYCYIMNSWQVTETDDKTKILEKASDQIKKAKNLTSNNDELMVLEALNYQAMILINPVKNGPTLSVKAENLLQKAQAVNKNNPRALFLRGQNMYYRPEQFGGGKEKALPFFEKADELYNNNVDDFLQPVWGLNTNSEMLKICQK